ncbi:MAG: SUMF1/EgtB/PvdO family nonheme iron enzyme [Roseiarcus sp.]|uniref:SUMF1/EgtB/PvdO family nonheme iron enzyme n=1 Tax=Roseiarcus sp. TaxID=1969460 RepID=UPI003C28E46F
MRFSRLAIAAAAVATASLAAIGMTPPATAPSGASRPAVATLQPGWFAYRPLGDYESNGRVIDAPARATRLDAPLDVMVEPVSQAEYARCVAAAACPKLKSVDPAAENLPVVGVSWLEATAYAEWYAAKTGEDWRLPTDEEWAYAAAERFRGEPPRIASGDDFARRWLAKFDADSALARQPKAPQPFGHFGLDTLGVADLAGNVWEWTNSCYERRSVEAGGEARLLTRNCRVRALEGEHRTFMSDFIRDGVAGGCSVGPPPTNLGFRLVRAHASAVARMLSGVGALFAAL